MVHFKNDYLKTKTKIIKKKLKTISRENNHQQIKNKLKNFLFDFLNIKKTKTKLKPVTIAIDRKT